MTAKALRAFERDGAAVRHYSCTISFYRSFPQARVFHSCRLLKGILPYTQHNNEHFTKIGKVFFVLWLNNWEQKILCNFVM
jgi:hypothetical protein